MIRSSSDAVPTQNGQMLGYLDLLYFLDDYISTHPTSPFATHIADRLSAGYRPLTLQGMELPAMDFATTDMLSTVAYTFPRLPALISLLPDIEEVVREARLKKDKSPHDGAETETDRLKEDIDELICRLNEVEVELKMIRENL